MKVQQGTVAAMASFALTLLLAACGGKPAPNAQQAGVSKVNVYVVKTEQVPFTVELPGRTTPYQIAEIRPQISGIVQQRNFREGSDVHMGELLYVIDPAIYKAGYDSAVASLAKAEANLTPARLKAERYRELLKINAVSKQDAEDAEASFKQAEADVAANRASVDSARINLAYTRITSPIAGRVGKSSVTPGALLNANQAALLTTVQQLDPIYVDIAQSSTELTRIKRALEAGQIKRIGADAAKVKLLAEDGAPYALEGKLEFSDITVDAGTGAVTLRAVFPNPKHELLPGMFVRAQLEQGVNDKGMLVPQQGITRNPKGEATALVLGEDGKVVARVLQVGEAVGDKWLVKSGLSVGDKVIVEGLQKVKPGASAEVANTAADAAAAK
jgi:membrane fusion protein (multidrug efflux system)